MLMLQKGSHEVGLRLFTHQASKKLGIEDRLIRFERIIANSRGRCIGTDVVLHYVDSVYMPILQNSNQLTLAVEKRKIPRHIHNQFIKAMLLNDKATLRQLIRNYVENTAEEDEIVSQNQSLIPCFFGNCISNICTAGGGTCASNPTYPCISPMLINQAWECCTSQNMGGPGSAFDLVDNTPWISSYSTGFIGPNWAWNSQNNTIMLQASFTSPSCYPSSGVTLGLDFIVYYGSGGSGVTCASSCPSNSVCGGVTVPYCPGSYYTNKIFPVIYYNINLVALPSTSYVVWWQISV
jgi:hypothetical protein